ncbi:MAG: hypothetical protein IPK85_01015 [Gemmatimonadetes bacterium]|nr:hypothetical protein [Gemmatimonadota bacterium]
MKPTRPRWTISVLTIPERESYLRRSSPPSLRSPARPGSVVDVIYNRDTREAPADVEERVRGLVTGLQLNVYFNPANPTIGAARIQQLNHCKTPLVAFADDDLSPARRRPRLRGRGAPPSARGWRGTPFLR